MLKKSMCQPLFSLDGQNYVGPSYYLEVSGAELLPFPRLAVVVVVVVVVVVLGDAGEELGDDQRVWHHKVLREGRAAGLAGRLPDHCFFDLSCYQCSQELDLFVELVGIEIWSVAARSSR